MDQRTGPVNVTEARLALEVRCNSFAHHTVLHINEAVSFKLFLLLSLYVLYAS